MMTVKDKILALLLALAFNAFAAAWTGTTSEPSNQKKIDGKAFFVVTNANELAWFADQVNGGKTTINAVLNNDIVFGTDTSSVCSKTWTPIGMDSSHIFNGILDGNGFTVYGLRINGIKYAGLVGLMGREGVVRKISVAAGNYKSGGGFIGGLVGVNSGKVETVVNKNQISGNFAGGCVGWNAESGSVLNAWTMQEFNKRVA